MLTPEQVKNLKEQLMTQLVNFPEDKREQMKEQILMMNDKQFEEFLIQNGLISAGEGNEEEDETRGKEESKSGKKGKLSQECVFCSILGGKIPSYKIDENKDAIAVLEINPLSKGHLLVVPKEHGTTDKIPSSSFALAKKIAKKIKNKLKPKEIKISTQNIMGHALVEVLPLYGTEKERKKASENEMFELQKLLISKPREKKEKKEKVVEKKDLGLPKVKPRIP